MHSIRFKITAVTVAAVLISILVMSGIGILMLRMESDRSSVEKLSLISENVQGRLDAYLNSLKQSMEMGIHMADDSLSDLDLSLLGSSLPPEKLEKLDAILSEHCAEVEHAFSSIANNTNGITTYYYCINSELGSSEHGFFWSNLGENEFVKQPPLISTDLDINDIEHTTWYYSPLKAGRAVWVGPYTAHYLGELLTISYVAPIYRYGFLIGVLGMDILFDTIIDQVSSMKVYETGSVLLMDKEGHFLYHPEFSMGSSPDIQLSSQNTDPDTFKKSRSGDMMIRYTVNGEERQMAYATLTNNIKVIVTAPVSEINASQHQMVQIIVLAAAAIIALFTLFMLLVTNAITRPLLRLTAASQKFSDGDYDVELDYQGQDEVGILTGAFRRMRDHLQLYISDLNSRAFSDALTGVKNKGAFNITLSRLNDAIRQGGKETPPEFGFVVFDCNNLKQINDENGHLRGDIYLQNSCALICRVFAHSPVFRMGGDEFSVLLQKEDYENRDALMAEFDRIAAEYNAEEVEAWNKVSLSKGMAVYDPENDNEAEDVYQHADDLMYEEKRYYHK